MRKIWVCRPCQQPADIWIHKIEEVHSAPTLRLTCCFCYIFWFRAIVCSDQGSISAHQSLCICKCRLTIRLDKVILYVFNKLISVCQKKWWPMELPMFTNMIVRWGDNVMTSPDTSVGVIPWDKIIWNSFDYWTKQNVDFGLKSTLHVSLLFSPLSNWNDTICSHSV